MVDMNPSKIESAVTVISGVLGAGPRDPVRAGGGWGDCYWEVVISHGARLQAC